MYNMYTVYIYIYTHIYIYICICILYSEVFLTMTEVFPCFFLSCKANARAKLAKTGHDLHSSTLVVICVVLCIVCV